MSTPIMCGIQASLVKVSVQSHSFWNISPETNILYILFHMLGFMISWSHKSVTLIVYWNNIIEELYMYALMDVGI